jgi:hypothetical protein
MLPLVIPAKAGIQRSQDPAVDPLYPRFHGEADNTLRVLGSFRIEFYPIDISISSFAAAAHDDKPPICPILGGVGAIDLMNGQRVSFSRHDLQ